MKGAKQYSQEELRRRRGILNWLQGPEARNRPRIWSHLDQQERHPGNRFFEQAAWVNSPIGEWQIRTTWPPREKGEKREEKPPLSVRVQDTMYWMKASLHPEWGWTWRNSSKVKEWKQHGLTVVKVARALAVDWVLEMIVEVPKWAELALKLVKEGWERGIGKQRYPRSLKLRIDEKDKEHGELEAKKEIRGLTANHRMGVNRRYEWIVEREILKRIVERHLRLNTEWLRVGIEHTINWEGVVRSTKVIIKVHRSGRVLATYKTANPWEREWGEDRRPTGILRFEDTGERKKGEQRDVVVKDELWKRANNGIIPIPIVVASEKRIFKVEISKDCGETEEGTLYVAADDQKKAWQGALQKKGVQNRRQEENEGWGGEITDADPSKVRITEIF